MPVPDGELVLAMVDGSWGRALQRRQLTAVSARPEGGGSARSHGSSGSACPGVCSMNGGLSPSGSERYITPDHLVPDLVEPPRLAKRDFGITDAIVTTTVAPAADHICATPIPVQNPGLII